MTINDLEDYDKTLEAAYYTPKEQRDDITYACSISFCLCPPPLLTFGRFPYTLPFSQMYPVCCHELRNLLDQINAAPVDHFRQTDMLARARQEVRSLDRFTMVVTDILLDA